MPATFRQVSPDNDYYIPIASLVGRIVAKNETSGALTPANWASLGSKYTSSISTAGAGLLKDVGKTYISGGRTFRKVQLVVPQTGTVSTFGVGGYAATSPVEDYLTGYIEIGFDATTGTGPTPVAKWGR